jgi:hypothetical protein
MSLNNSVAIFTSSKSAGIKTRGIEMQGKYVYSSTVVLLPLKAK